MLDADPISDPPDGGNRSVQAHRRFHAVVKGMGDAIHAADGLEHGRLHVPDMLEHIRQADRRRWRKIDDEHYGISIPFARGEVPVASLAGLRARRPDGDLRDIVPFGAGALTALVKRHIEHGLTKFVLRALDGGGAGDLAWLADTVLPLQT